MASTPAGLCNLALGLVGHRDPIGSLAEATTAAQACDVAYPHCRDLVLEAHPWRWATRRAVLAVLADAERGGYAYAYALPADFVRMGSGIYAEENRGSLETEAGRVPFQLEGDATAGRVLVTDRADAELPYVARIEDLARWPAGVQDALVWLLASRLAYSVAVKPQLGVAHYQHYERVALPRAIAADANQAQKSVPAEAEAIRARS